MSVEHTYILSCVQLFVTPWTVDCQVPQSMGFSRQEYWSGLAFPPPAGLLDPGMELMSPEAPALAGRFSTTEPPEKFQCQSKEEWIKKTCR